MDIQSLIKVLGEVADHCHFIDRFEKEKVVREVIDLLTTSEGLPEKKQSIVGLKGEYIEDNRQFNQAIDLCLVPYCVLKVRIKELERKLKAIGAEEVTKAIVEDNE